jgi:uncharacterized membrane protein
MEPAPALIRTAGTTASAAANLGPIPSAQVAEGWERLVDGAAERILRMAEAQGVHRQELARMHLEHVIRLQALDQETRRQEVEWDYRFKQSVLEAQLQMARQGHARARIGQCFGLMLGAGALFVAGFLGVRGQPWVAAVMGTGGLAGIIWASVSSGRKSAEEDRRRRSPGPPDGADPA